MWTILILHFPMDRLFGVKTKQHSTASVSGSDDEEWYMVSMNEGVQSPTGNFPSEYEFVTNKEIFGFSGNQKTTRNSKRRRKGIEKTFEFVEKEPSPCHEWYDCEKCFTEFIDAIPYIDESEEEKDLPGDVNKGMAAAEGARALSPRMKRILSPRVKSSLKRSFALYQICEEAEKENRKPSNGSSEEGRKNCQDDMATLEKENLALTDRSEKARKGQEETEQFYLKYDKWDSCPNKSNKRRKSNPFQRQRIKQSKFWGIFGWSSKKGCHYS